MDTVFSFLPFLRQRLCSGRAGLAYCGQRLRANQQPLLAGAKHLPDHHRPLLRRGYEQRQCGRHLRSRQSDGVHGGDFEGIEQKLDYIKALGATAIWISPIVLNTEGQFHGYSAWNFYEVAPHWGIASPILQHLVQAAHARGLLVIDDIVVNHAGDLVTGSGSGYPNFNYPAGYALSYVNSSKTYPAPFNLTTTNPSLTNLFHNYGNIDNFNDTQPGRIGLVGRPE